MLNLFCVLLYVLFSVISCKESEADPVVYTPKSLCIRLTTNTTALLQWVEPATIRSEILGYKIYYTTDHKQPLNNWNTQAIGNSPMTTIRNIELGKTYSFRIQVHSLGLEGPEPISGPYTFIMFNRIRSCYDHPPTPQIVALNFLRASAISQDSVEVWWNLEYDSHQVTGFQVFYGLEGSNEWQYKLIGLAHSTVLTNLLEGDVYRIGIAAVKSSGVLDYYPQEVTVKVQPEVIPSDLKVYNIKPDSMILKWSHPIGLNPLKYKISYDAVKDFIDSQGIRQHFQYERVEKYVDRSFKDYVLTYLRPYTNYSINVTAIPVDYSYRPPGRITAQTEMAAPNPLVKPDVVSATNSDNVQIFLPIASEEFGPISYYYLVVVPDTGVDLPSKAFSTKELLENEWEEEEDITTPYITAKFSGKIPYAFILGGPDAGGFKNHKLSSDKKYRVFLRAVVVTPSKEIFTDSPYSDYFTLNSTKAKQKPKTANVI